MQHTRNKIRVSDLCSDHKLITYINRSPCMANSLVGSQPNHHILSSLECICAVVFIDSEKVRPKISINKCCCTFVSRLLFILQGHLATTCHSLATHQVGSNRSTDTHCDMLGLPPVLCVPQLDPENTFLSFKLFGPLVDTSEICVGTICNYCEVIVNKMSGMVFVWVCSH